MAKHSSKRLKEFILILVSYIEKPLCSRVKVLSIDSTFDLILNSSLSVVRFGDGEMAIIRGYGLKFQKYDPVLSLRLKQLLADHVPGLLICLPDVFGDLNRFRPKARRFFRTELGRSRRHWMSLISTDQFYGNSFISRLYIDWEDKSTAGAWFEKAKRLWFGKKVVLVEGVYSRLGVGNDLFDGASTITRVLCPATDSFTKYDEIVSTCLELSADHLFLIALGPTAKLLSYDLHQRGYQAIDIGHIDVEYSWYLKQSLEKETVEGKYVNEVETSFVEKNPPDYFHKQIYRII